jgi:cell division septum initiation protein DivIVA
MSNTSPDRLDRIEAALESLSQEVRATNQTVESLSQEVRATNQTVESLSQEVRVASQNADRVCNSIDTLVQTIYVRSESVEANMMGFREELASANETARMQAESVRELIRLLNQKQA